MRNMKDSGIEWIGEIPEDWKVGKVKNIKDKKLDYPIGDGDHGQIKPEMYLDKGIPYIRVQNLTWGKDISYDGMVYISNEVQMMNKKSILLPKDILIAKTGATVGKAAIIPDNMPEANTTSSVGKISIDKENNNYLYFYYVISSD